MGLGLGSRVRVRPPREHAMCLRHGRLFDVSISLARPGCTPTYVITGGLVREMSSEERDYGLGLGERLWARVRRERGHWYMRLSMSHAVQYVGFRVRGDLPGFAPGGSVGSK